MISYLIELAHIAGKIAREHFDTADFASSTTKGRGDYVTFVDKRIEDVLATRIRSQFPDHAIVGEESHNDLRHHTGPCWIIDPIDGTTNFIRGIPAYAISIAFCDANAQPKYSVIYDPSRDETFVAERGAGTRLNKDRKDTSGCTNINQSLISCSLPFRTMQPLDDIATVISTIHKQCDDSRRCGSAALDLAWVAIGRIDAYWELGIWPWDTAAGELLVRSAGGVCSDFRGATDGLLGRRSIIAAATPELHETLLKQIQPTLSYWLDDPAFHISEKSD